MTCSWEWKSGLCVTACFQTYRLRNWNNEVPWHFVQNKTLWLMWYTYKWTMLMRIWLKVSLAGDIWNFTCHCRYPCIKSLLKMKYFNLWSCCCFDFSCVLFSPSSYTFSFPLFTIPSPECFPSPPHTTAPKLFKIYTQYPPPPPSNKQTFLMWGIAYWCECVRVLQVL